MIERPMKWYHYIMPNFGIQVVITMGCFILGLIQFGFYDVLEEEVVIFDGQCKVTVGPVDEDGEVHRGATMQCGDDTRNLGALEVPYLYEALTHSREPVIMCVKTESEFLKEINWKCIMNPEEKEQV